MLYYHITIIEKKQWMKSQASAMYSAQNTSAWPPPHPPLTSHNETSCLINKIYVLFQYSIQSILFKELTQWPPSDVQTECSSSVQQQIIVCVCELHRQLTVHTHRYTGWQYHTQTWLGHWPTNHSKGKKCKSIARFNVNMQYRLSKQECAGCLHSQQTSQFIPVKVNN